MSYRSCLAAAISIALACSPAFAGATGTRAASLASACASCHGLPLKAAETRAPLLGAGGIPSLEGMEETSIAQSLRDFRSGKRSSQIMEVVAGALSMGEIDEVAHAIASRPRHLGQ